MAKITSLTQIQAEFDAEFDQNAPRRSPWSSGGLGFGQNFVKRRFWPKNHDFDRKTDFFRPKIRPKILVITTVDEDETALFSICV